MDRLDDIVRDALRALEGQAPRDYFDELPARIDARLEGSMQTEQDRDADARSPRIPGAEAMAASDGTPRNEDSGLHDIKQLAHSTKERIRRQSSQHDAGDQLLTASQSGLHAVALPVPSRMSQRSADEERELAMTASGVHAAVAVDEPRPITSAPRRAPAEKAEKSRGVPAWLWAGGGLAAAAAAVLAFTQLGGEKDQAPAVASETAAPAPTAAAPAGAVEQEGITVRGIEETGAGAAAQAPVPPAADTAVAPAETAPSLTDPAPDEADKKLEKRDDAKSDRAERKNKSEESSKGGATETKKDAAKDATKDVKKADGKGGGATKLDGAVLGAGDSDELGIGDVIGGGGGKKDDKPAKTELTAKEMRDGLAAINADAKACYGAHGVGGTVKVKLTIDPSGKVSKASATGEFAGTPTGDCVAAAVKSASFPAWDGGPKSTMFVVLLSD